jgi:hypothetical protein
MAKGCRPWELMLVTEILFAAMLFAAMLFAEILFPV